jgi:hypothetical protein
MRIGEQFCTSAEEQDCDHQGAQVARASRPCGSPAQPDHEDENDQNGSEGEQEGHIEIQ